ncbi:MAG: ABC transporter permease [Microthrixaceae bacterium]
MSDYRVIGLVVAREVHEALRRKTLWITAALVLVGATALVVVPTLIDSNDVYKVGLVGEANSTVTDALRASGNVGDFKVELKKRSNVSAARNDVKSGDLDAALVHADTVQLIVQQESGELVTALRGALAADRTVSGLKDAGLSDAQITNVLGAPDIDLDVVDADRSGRIAAATIISIAMYGLLFLVTMQVANGVAIEKANRVSEVLVAIVPPRTLLLGKVAGVGLTALIPLVAGALPVVIRLGTSDSLPPGTGFAVAAAAAWFVLGAGFYLLAAGALGALVERQEDVGSAIAALSILLIGSYLVGQTAPDSPVGTVLAFLPFSSPMVEPGRLALGVSSVPEVVVSLVIGVLSVLFMARLATLVYERAVVRTGRRLHLSDVLRSKPDPG